MPQQDLDTLRREIGAVALAWGAIAAGAAVVALAVRLTVREVRPFPSQRLRATSWTGPLVCVAFLVFAFVPEYILPYLDRAALVRWLTGRDVDEKPALVIARCVADMLGLPLQLAAWAGLLLLAGRPVVIDRNARRAGGAYVAAVRTFLVLTPIVYAVSFAAVLVVRITTGEKPDEHPIVQVVESVPASSGVFALLLVQAVVVAPVREELLFRGIVQPYFADRPWGGDLAIWLAAVVGVATHASKAGDFGFGANVAPALFAVAVLVPYRLMDRLDLPRWLPVRDPVARQQVARAVVGTALLFANFHANVWPTPIPLFVLALGLGWLAFRTQSVLAPIVLHMLFNAIVFAALVLPSNF